MRIARKLMLLAMPALAVAALTAPSALAQETEPELHNQIPRLVAEQEVHAANDINCPAVVPTPPVAVSPLVTAGGCRLHVASIGIVSMTQHDGAGVETVVTNCALEFDIRIDAAAEGWMSHHEFTGPAGICTVKACGQVTPPTSEGRAYSFHLRETEPAPREVAQILICTEPIGGGAASHCEITIPFTEGATHRYTFTAQDAQGHGAFTPRCEWTGTLLTEAGGPLSGEASAYHNVEISHT